MGAALKFRHAGWRVTFLGARTPTEHLVRVVRVTQPQVVALSAVNDEGVERFKATLSEMMHDRGDAEFVVGGRAAELHADVVTQLGARMVTTADEWAEMLG